MRIDTRSRIAAAARFSAIIGAAPAASVRSHALLFGSIPFVVEALTLTSGDTAPGRRARRLQAFSGDRTGWTIVVALLVIRTAIGRYRIALPGLQNDEVLFVNAATLRIPSIFITHTIDGIPLMVFPYIGALKSWLYAPVFSLFGTSPTTIRFPAELIAGSGLLLLYPAIRDLVNRPVALAAFAALCFDGSLFWLTRNDVGPNAIELFMKCAVIFCAARLMRDRRMRWLVLMLAALALGLFNKLNFIWVVNAALVVSLLVAIDQRHRLREHQRLLAVWFCGLALIYATFAAYYLGDEIALVGGPAHHGSVLAHTWPQYITGMKAVLSGVWFFDYALAPIGPRMIVVLAFLALFVTGSVASVLRRTRSLPVASLTLVTVLMSVQTLDTYQATAGWHYVSVYPFITIVAAYGAWSGALLLTRRRSWAVMALGAVTLATVAYDGVLFGTYFRQLEHEPSFSAWSPAIYRLSRFIQRTPGTVFIVDWGILTPLFALHQTHRYDDEEFALTDPAPANLTGIGAQIAGTPGPKLIVTHTDAKLVFPTVNANLERATRGHLRLVRTIDGDGEVPVFLIYRYATVGG